MAEQNQNIISFRYGTFEDYQALSVHDTNTIYFTTNPNLIYKGDELYSKSQSVQYLTEYEYEELANTQSCDGAVIYLVIDNTTSQLKYIYVGYVLIGRASESGSIGFPYTFPIIF